MRRFVFALCLILASCGAKAPRALSDAISLKSPDGKNEVRFEVIEGVPYYSMSREGADVVLPSRLGFKLVDGELEKGFMLGEVARKEYDGVWEPVWGEEAEIRENYREMLVSLYKEGVRMDLRFRLFDDGLGLRYEFPSQQNLTYFKIDKELTEVALPGDPFAWWISGDYDSQEYHYLHTRLSEIPALEESSRVAQNSQAGLPVPSVQTAVQLKTDDGLYINVHEAEVVDFPTANLEVDGSTLRYWLTPDAEGVCGRMQTPCKTPWRTVMVCDKATDVLASRLILNLNEPCAIEDVSWIHPVKYMGVWWEMITGRTQWSYTWDYPSVVLGETDYTKATPHGQHAANNENVRFYIDFAAENGFDGLLIEGWNEGWEDWFGHQKDYVFDFVTPYPDFDIAALNAYAHSKGIRLIMHHETSSSVWNYERHIDAAYDLMNRYGYNAVKSGYVGNIIPYGEHHYSQPIINHYNLCIRKAADHHIMVNAHEAVRPTGLCRTWPNMIGNESAMGTEYRGGINPGHTAILPFTRLQGGPMDYTPGIFETDMSVTAPGQTGMMHHTICNQLGLYVTLYSPLQMAADVPENYFGVTAFQFIKDVAVDWDRSVYIEAEPGEVVVIARHPKLSTLNKSAEELAKLPDGKKDAVSSAARFVYALDEKATARDLAKAEPRDVWYVGGVGGEEPRDVAFALDFLREGLVYEAKLYYDSADTEIDTNPKSYSIYTNTVCSADSAKVHIPRGGGFAISLREIK